MIKKFYILLFLIVGLAGGVSAQVDPNPGTEPSAKIIKTYPNPATSIITFEFQRSYDRGYALQIFNFTGKKVAEAPSLLTKTTIRLDNFYRGVYMFRLLDRSGKVLESGKFQVVK